MGNPGEFVGSIIGKQVTVKLNTGVEYKGILSSIDGCLNLSLEDTQEFIQGQLKNKYGEAFIRGNNVLFLSKN